MENLKRPTCPINNLEELPIDIIKKKDLKFPEVHLEIEEMISCANEIKKYRGDDFYHLPFCLTVESEYLGGIINLGNEKVGPRVKSYKFNTIDELLEIDFSLNEISLRMETLFNAIKELSKTGDVIFNVNGPFTVLTSLIDMKVVFNAIRKENLKFHLLMEKIMEFIFKFTVLGVEAGAKIISYADATGDISMIGPKIFKEFSAPLTIEIIDKIEPLLNDQILHICNKLTNGLLEVDFIELTTIKSDKIESYGEAINKAFNEKNIKVIGNRCIKTTHLKKKEMSVYCIKNKK